MRHSLVLASKQRLSFVNCARSFLTLGTVIFALNTTPLLAEPTPYLQQLVTAATAKKLATEPHWHLLLHYVPRWLGGVKSEADGPGFFNAKNGKYNPQAELDATLAAFFAPPSQDAEVLHPQCKHIARYRWLKNQLHFDAQLLPEQPCPRFDTWRQSVRGDSLTLIFASYYLNNPASMFGHTLLRFDRHHDTGRGQPLLDYAVNYAANTGNDGGLAFTWFGLSGGYPGTFSNYPYYFKVQEYNNIRRRDLWEYQLHFTPIQIDQLLEHLWELGSTYFDYYFIDENCSYHILSLLEIADPNLKLKAQFRFFAAPSDTVKVIWQQPNLVQAVRYRPSVLSRFRQKQSALSPVLQRDLVQLIAQPTPETIPTDLSPTEQAMLLDAALNYFEINQPKASEAEKTTTQKLRNVRAALPALDDPAQPQTYSTPPHLGHASSRAGLQVGSSLEQGAMLELTTRFAYHDLLNDDSGYLPYGQIEALDLRLRYYTDSRTLQLENLKIIEVTSLTPRLPFQHALSWNVGFGIETLRFADCLDCQAFYLHGGPGLTFKSHILDEEIYYFMFNLNTQFSNSLSSFARLAPQVEAGSIWRLGKLSKIQLRGRADYAPFWAQEHSYEFSAAWRLSLSLNQELRLQGNYFVNDQELYGGWYLYF